MIPSKNSKLALLVGMAFVMAACSGLKSTTTGGTGTGTGTGSYTIGGSIQGLTGTGLVLVDTIDGKTPDSLTVAANSTTFTFKTSVASGATYAVTVQTQPTNPGQTCAVTAGSGTVASANVTTVAIACTTNAVTATIGGTLSGLASGGSVILQDNGGDALTLTANGAFTFKTPVTGPTDAYAVTVSTQPTSPLQICTVANGSGTASANVTNVAVTCVLAYTIGGNLTGLVGSGLILQDAVTMGTTQLFTEQLTIGSGSSGSGGNSAFTFTKDVPTGATYTVSIAQQPTGPVQTCIVTPSTATGTATANVISVVVTCPAVTYSVGGTVVGLAGISPNNGPITDGSFVIEDFKGNTLTITENGPFTFATSYALNDQYQVSILHSSDNQIQACTRWNPSGIVTANVTNIVIDCSYNDWTWIDGTNTAGTTATPEYGSFPSSAPTEIPNPFTNTPGARFGAAGWTDKYGNLFMFGGDGWELAGNPAPDTLDADMDDLWVCTFQWSGGNTDYCEWQLVGGYDPTKVTVGGTATTVGAQIILNAQYEAQGGSFPGTPLAPEAREGAATWTDKNGNFWLFGGQTPGAKFVSELWEYNTTNLNPTTYTATEGVWTEVGGLGVDQPGVYTGAGAFPGSRVNAASWTDQNGNFWLFGGYGYDGSGNVGYLNDLWEYTGGSWTWVSGGATNLANQNGAYATSGAQMPGGRHEAATWVDGSGNLWLFGGEGEDSVGTANGILNDLWMYSITGNQWTFVMGSTTANQTGIYESAPVVGPVSTTGAASTCGLASGLLNPTPPPQYLCTPVSTTGALPGSRYAAAAWTDAGGNLWLFGGWGLDSSATNGNGALNDTWVYTPNATPTQPGTWAWVKGSNTGSTDGFYGSLIRPYATYYLFTPGGRSNATHWVDKYGQLWLFGGEGQDSTGKNGTDDFLNDMWRYLPYQN
ncbi:MAG TPA: kelch repeat-containing protein [Candidatus Sulfotelmatobacter sp.]|nr:kelch repeat-containing protein [Candidatus Sulfotelmatobacter sp.]